MLIHHQGHVAGLYGEELTAIFGNIMAFAAVFGSLFNSSGIPRLSTNILDELEKAAEDLLLDSVSGAIFSCIFFICSAYQIYYFIRLSMYFRTRKR